MRLISLTCAGAFALALAACSSGGNSSDGAAVGTSQETVPANLQDDPDNSLVPVSQPTPAPLTAFPDDFQGRWGLTPADCEAGRADAKGLMVVGSTSLTFYESRATIDQLLQAAPDRLDAKLSYSGEGETWKQSAMLTLTDGGKTLTRATQDPDENNRYARCPAVAA